MPSPIEYSPQRMFRLVAGSVLLIAVGCGQRAAVPSSAGSVSAGTGETAPTTPVSDPVVAEPNPAELPLTAVIGHDDGKPRGEIVPVTVQTDPTPVVFDRAAYLRDPNHYTGQVIADRAWHIAQPGADVPFLEAVGGTSLVAPTGSVIRLSARTQPHMPVTWTSLGHGAFAATGQASISVAADANGIASAVFRLTEEVSGSVLITAASPVCGNTLSYLIRVAEATP